VPTIGFFAAREDLVALLDWLLVRERLRACEAYSELDSPLRHFRTPAEVATAFDMGNDRHGTGVAIHLALWSREVLPEPQPRRIDVKPARGGGATFRFAAEGNGLIYLLLGGLHERVITRSTVSQNSETRAETWGVGEGVDWEGANKLWARISYHLRKRASTAAAGSSPVLPQALALVDEGYELKVSSRSPGVFAITRRKS
jgi:hypothetical protein